jgi:hypothetical protein
MHYVPGGWHAKDTIAKGWKDEAVAEAQFHYGESELQGKIFELVVSSSSLRYFESWRETACKLASATREFL